MPKITLEIPESFEFRRSDVVMSIKPTEYPKDMLAQLLLHGFVQKIGDAAAGLKDDPAKAREKMESVDAQLKEGVWGATRGGSDPMEYYRAMILAKLLLAHDKADKAWFGKGGGFLTESVDTVMERFAKLPDASKAAIETDAKAAWDKAKDEAEKRRKAKEADKAKATAMAAKIDLSAAFK